MSSVYQLLQAARALSDIPFERYADDAICHCCSEAQARMLLAALERRFDECGLTLHPEKTKIVYCKDEDRGRNYPNQTFDFLGYTFRPRLSRRKAGRVASRSVPHSQPRLARRSAKPYAAGRFICVVTSPWKIWRACSMRTYAAGSTTMAGSTPLRFIPLCGASMSSWRDGPTGSSSPYTGIKRGPSTGCSALRAVKQGCSLIGACFSDAAGQWEPYEARASRTVLRAPGGETPPGDSPQHLCSQSACR